MNEENRFSPKKRWTRIFRKRWFFPSVFLILAALLISAFVWYQNMEDERDLAEEPIEQTGDYTPIPNDDTAVPVMEQQEVFLLPVANPEEAQIVTKFFDYDADEEDKLNALIHYNNRYYQSTGIDIAANDEGDFDVVAALSGTVSEVKEDPLLGNVVVIEHEDDVKTFYASLGEVSVEQGESVEQGDVIGTAGQSNFGKENGTHVHFEIRKNDIAVNPEALFNQPLASLDRILAAMTEEEEDGGSDEAAEDESEEDEGRGEESEDGDADREDTPTEEESEETEEDQVE